MVQTVKHTHTHTNTQDDNKMENATVINTLNYSYTTKMSLMLRLYIKLETM